MKYTKKTTHNEIHILLEWHKRNNRNNLLWRNTKNPWVILISELLLQKTTVLQVKRVISLFLEKYPNPYKVLENEEGIKEIIVNLGLSNIKTKRIIDIAKITVNEYEGKIPNNKKDLLKLPGIGKYIANSVMYLAYEENYPIVDTNIIRVLERYYNFNSEHKRQRMDNKYWDFVSSITPKNQTKETNLMLLDFGALICSARKPKCEICPIKFDCNYDKLQSVRKNKIINKNENVI